MSLKESTLAAFEGVDVNNMLSVNHSEAVVIMKWHQQTEGLFERLAKLSLEQHAEVTLMNNGDFIEIRVTQIDE